MIYHVYANRSNVGDWYAARSIQRLLGTPVQELLCDAPFARAALARLEAVGPGDVVVIGAGGLLMDYFDSFWAGVLQLPADTPIVLWGVGCCSVKHSASSMDPSLLRRVVDRAELVAVRDELTLDALPDDARVQLVPCPSLAVDLARSISSPPVLLHATHAYTIGDAALVEVRSQARAFAEATGRRYVETDNRIPPDDLAALDRGVDSIASADVVVSSRLHGCLLGLAARRPVIAISGDEKVDSFMAWAGLRDWLVDAADRDDVLSLRDRLDRITSFPEPRGTALAADAARRSNLEVAAAVHSLHRSARRAS